VALLNRAALSSAIELNYLPTKRKSEEDGRALHSSPEVRKLFQLLFSLLEPAIALEALPSLSLKHL